MQNHYPHNTIAQHPAHSTSHESSSVSSTASPQAPLPPLVNFSNSGPPSRPSSGLNISLPPQQALPPGPPFPGQGYSRPFESNSASPADHSALYPEGILPNGLTSGNASLSQAHMAAAGLQTQKRAYRQRRKDPSCDACRERKVKCDATDTTSCTECSSRNVRCQFTKDTNRRMSSIKQVQDLEKQLANRDATIAHLRSMIPKTDLSMDLDRDQTRHPLLNIPDVGRAPKRRKLSPLNRDLSEVRTNLRDYGRGVVKIPPPYRQNGSQPSNPPSSPNLPPKEVADNLLQLYHSCVHTVIPILHFPTFREQYNRVYEAKDVRIMPREWGAVLFAIFAVGALHSLDPHIDRLRDGKRFLMDSMTLIDQWQDHFAVDQSRAALLVSMFLNEINIKSAAWVWLGSATRIAQDIGLHVETGPWPRIEGEMRKRLWWGLYAWDRLLSLELSRPMLIVDEDCDVDLPCPVDDQFIQEHGIFIPATQANHGSSFLLTTIHVVRALPHLIRIFKSDNIALSTLEGIDSHLIRCMAAFPPECQLSSDQYLDPRSLAPILYLQNARFLLHRHNLSPSCTPETRETALDHCVVVAQETTHLVSRSMQNAPSSSPRIPSVPGGSDDWESRLRMAASTFICTHIWRCTLILLFRAEYASARTLIRASATIGDLRPANVSCGRHTAFFLRCLINKLRQEGPRPALEQDEKMIAYVSGDLQGSTDSSWIWQGSETGMQLSEIENRHHHLHHPHHPHHNSPHMLAMDAERNGIQTVPSQGDLRALPASTSLTEAETSDWGGWEWIEETVKLLHNEQQQQQRQQQQRQQQPPTITTNFLPSQAPPGQRLHQTLHHQQKGGGGPPGGITVNTTNTATSEIGVGISGPASAATVTPGSSSTSQMSPPPPRSSPASASRMTIANII